MKKIFYIGLISFFIIACQGNKPVADVTDKTSAKNILLSYLSMNEEGRKLLPSFSVCQLKLTQNKPSKRNIHTIDAYTCEIAGEDGVKNIFVISAAPELKNEVDPRKKTDQTLVYIAHLTYNQQNNQLFGNKLLFNPNQNKIVVQKEVIAYSNED